jgi:prophage maintenance system killer protein
VLFLTLDDIIESHQNQIDTYGGSHGIRDIGLLESAIAQPEASFGACTQTFLKWLPLIYIIW